MYRVEFWPAWYLQKNVCARLDGHECWPYRSRSGAVWTTRASLTWCPGEVHLLIRLVVTIWCLSIAVPDTNVADKSLTKRTLVLRGRNYAGAGAAEMKMPHCPYWAAHTLRLVRRMLTDVSYIPHLTQVLQHHQEELTMPSEPFHKFHCKRVRCVVWQLWIKTDTNPVWGLAVDAQLIDCDCLYPCLPRRNDMLQGVLSRFC